MAAVNNSIDMVNGPLWGKILKFTLMYMLTAFLQQLYAAADILVVGRFAGEVALAGVGTCAVLTNFFLNFILGLSAGATIVIGQLIGAREKEGIQKAAHTAIAIAIYGGLIISIVCFLFARQLLGLIGVPQDVLPEALDYLRITSIGFVPTLIYNFGAAMLRSKGDTKRTLYIVIISGIINVLFNLFFVCVLKMKASGVAVATVISQVFNAVVMMHILCHETDEMKISLRSIRIYKKPFMKMLKYGLPSGIQSSVYSVSNVLVQATVNSFGAAAIAGASAASSITSFYDVMVGSIYNSSLVFTSQNFGAKKFDRIKKIIGICVAYLLGIWAIQALVTLFGGRFLIGLYAPDQLQVIDYGVRKLSVLGYTYGIVGCINIISGALRGLGSSLVSMIISIVGVCGIRIVWILTVFKAIGTFEALLVCYPLSWSGTFVMLFVMFLFVFKNKKKKALL